MQRFKSVCRNFSRPHGVQSKMTQEQSKRSDEVGFGANAKQNNQVLDGHQAKEVYFDVCLFFDHGADCFYSDQCISIKKQCFLQ